MSWQVCESGRMVQLWLGLATHGSQLALASKYGMVARAARLLAQITFAYWPSVSKPQWIAHAARRPIFSLHGKANQLGALADCGKATTPTRSAP